MKPFLIKTLQNLVVWLSRLLRKINRENISSTFSLVPQVLKDPKDIEKIQPYMDLLDKGLEDPTITNIAVSGQYGSGKSSVIRTYQDIHAGKFKYLNISLASFKDDKKEFKDKKEIKSKIELSILQQIFYHEKPQALPETRFNRISSISFPKSYFFAFITIIWLLSCILLYNSNYGALNPYTWTFNKEIDWILLLTSVVSSLGLIVLLKNIYIGIRGASINKFNIKGEVEIGGKFEKSIFNKHLDEILYFFQMTEYDVVIVEDLDRFGTTDIFAKLREINLILNSSKQINRPINFLYAVRDELFKDKTERVKFFDLIVPIIPFINPSNAGEQFKELLEELHIEKELSNGLIEDVITFIDDIDMRLLKNILIEYKTYSQVLPPDLKQDNLFSILVYKNLSPSDFGKLSKRKGKLYSLISNKESYVRSHLDVIDGKLSELDKTLSNTRSELAEDEQDLRRIYISRFFEKYPSTYQIEIESIPYRLDDLIEEENFEKLFAAKRFLSESINSNAQRSVQWFDIDMNSFQKEVDENFTYYDRKEFIQNKSPEKVTAIKSEMAKLKSRKEIIKDWSLVEIFQEVDLDGYLDKFNDVQVVKNLIINGYINEDYNDYISLFHGVSISKEDFKFLQSVKTGSVSKFDYKLDEVENLINKISLKYFSRTPILNFAILDLLLIKKKTYTENLDLFFSVLRQNKPRSEEFIIKYLSRQMNIELFIAEFSKTDDTFWELINQSEDISDIAKDVILGEIISTLPLEELEKQNSNNGISKYLAKIEDYQRLDSLFLNRELLIKVFQSLEVEIHNLPKTNTDTFELFYLLYNTSFYDLHINNIKTVIEEVNENDGLIDYDSALYSTIYLSSCDDLIDRIKGDPNNFVENVLLKSAKSTNENSQSINVLLNNEELKFDLKCKVIDWLENKLVLSTQIMEESVISELLKRNKIKADWGNIIDYLDRKNEEEIEFDEEITTFLNIEENYLQLSKERINTSLNEEEANENIFKSLSKAIIYNKNISDDAYSALLPAIPYNYNSISFNELEESKSKILIQSGIINPTQTIIDNIDSNHPQLKISLFERRQFRLKNTFGAVKLSDEDYQNIICSKEIKDDLKIKVIIRIEEDIILENRQVLSSTAGVISRVDNIKISNHLIVKLIEATTKGKTAILIINKYSDQLDDEEIKIVVSSLGFKYKEVFVLQHKPIFENNELNQKLFSILKTRGLIKNIKPVKKGKEIKIIANYK